MGIEGIASTSRPRAELKHSAGSPPRPFESRSARYDSSHTGAWPPPGKLRGISRSSDGTPDPGSSPRLCLVPQITASGRRPAPHAASPRVSPRAGQAAFTFGLQLSPEMSGTLNTREVGRGWDTSTTDTRPGPSDVVRTPPAAAVRPFPGIHRLRPGPGLDPDGKRRARLGRVNTLSTMGREPDRCQPGSPTTSLEPLLARGADPPQY